MVLISMNKSHHILIFNTKNIFSTIIYLFIYFHSETRINIKNLKALKAGKNSQHYSQEWNIKYMFKIHLQKKTTCVKFICSKFQNFHLMWLFGLSCLCYLSLVCCTSY